MATTFCCVIDQPDYRPVNVVVHRRVGGVLLDRLDAIERVCVPRAAFADGDGLAA
jgi:hypothetical protein